MEERAGGRDGNSDNSTDRRRGDGGGAGRRFVSLPQARHAMAAVIVANVAVFFYQQKQLRENQHQILFGVRWQEQFFSVMNSTLPTMIVSMFSHLNLEHLLGNMIALEYYGRQVFVNTTSRTWRNPLAFTLLYFGSGVGGFAGASLLSSLYDRQWDRKLSAMRDTFAQSSPAFIPASWSQAAADAWTYASHLDGVTSNFMFRFSPRIGASGAVFGVMGARVYTSMANSSNFTKMTRTEAASMFARAAVECSLLPIHFDMLSTIVQDNVDHVGHAAGFVCGLLIGALIDAVSSWRQRRRC